MSQKAMEPSDLERWQSITGRFRSVIDEAGPSVTVLDIAFEPDESLIASDECQSRLRRFDEIVRPAHP